MTRIGVLAQLQAAYVARLLADETVQAFFGNPVRLFEDVPDNPVFPYIALGEDQEIPWLADCIDGSEVYITLHVWARDGGFGTVKEGSAVVTAALHDAPLALAGYRVVVFSRGGMRVMKDPDGLTTHGVLTFRALVNPA